MQILVSSAVVLVKNLVVVTGGERELVENKVLHCTNTRQLVLSLTVVVLFLQHHAMFCAECWVQDLGPLFCI